jgi:thiamine-phosphate pyrophosphorylase
MRSIQSKKGLLKKSRLYLILDKETAGKQPICAVARKAVAGRTGIIQLRDKSSAKERVLTDAYSLTKALSGTSVLFIINDYVDVAKIVDADGVHLGQSDTSIEITRRILGKDKLIGISCHNLKQALDAQNRGADYIGIGPVYRTSTKPEYRPTGLRLIRQVKSRIKIPFFAIGNINRNNLAGVKSAGAKKIAVCRAVLKSKDIKASIDELAGLLK